MKQIFRTFFALAGFLLSHSVAADSAVYEISKGKHKVYLAGTIHMLRSQDFPLPNAFDSAYKHAQLIYFETDMQRAKSPEFGQRFAQAMTLPNNSTLKDVLTASNWAALQAFAQKSQYPLSQTMMFNAAMNSILITITESKKLGVGDGVEAFYDAAARTDHKVIGELETGDDVLAYMKKFAQEDPNKIIESTLSDITSMPVELDKMIASWKAGDLDALQETFSERLRRETPLVYQALVVERNDKWMVQIEKLMKTPEVEMILVGSLHLPGKDGLLRKLKEAGYKVKPYH